MHIPLQTMTARHRQNLASECDRVSRSTNIAAEAVMYPRVDPLHYHSLVPMTTSPLQPLDLVTADTLGDLNCWVPGSVGA